MPNVTLQAIGFSEKRYSGTEEVFHSARRQPHSTHSAQSFTGSGNCVLVTSYRAPHSEQVKVSRHSGMAEKRALRGRSQYPSPTTPRTTPRTTPIPDFRAPD